MAQDEGVRQQYRKRPVVIEAVRLLPENYRAVADWADARITNSIDSDAYGEPIPERTRVALEIKTLEGRMIANLGDWVIRGVAGEFYPCKDEIFQASYEPQVYQAEVIDAEVVSSLETD